MTAQALREALSEPWVHGAHFDGQALRFGEPVNLDGLTLRSFDLSRAVFEQGFSARGATFRGMSWLKGATVHGAFDLTGAVLRNDLRLDGARADILHLSQARAEGVIDLDDAHFGALHLDHCICLANISLARAQIDGAFDLSESDLMGGVWARDARFGTVQRDGVLIEGRSVEFEPQA